MRPAAEAFGLGLLHGPAELLPVSSSAHLALLGRPPQDGASVAMHAGTSLALLAGRRAEARAALRWENVPFHLLAGAIPSAAGVAVRRAAAGRAAASRGAVRVSPSLRSHGVGRVEPAGRVQGGPRRIVVGMLAGSAALAWADRCPQERSRSDASLLDAAVLGVAQAAALWPGVSRCGATLTAARARRFTRSAAASLSRELGVPLLLGAAAFTSTSRARAESPPGIRREFDPSPGVAGVGSLAGTLAALPLLRVLERPLWPWSAYRAGIALALVGRSGRVAHRAPIN